MSRATTSRTYSRAAVDRARRHGQAWHPLDITAERAAQLVPTLTGNAGTVGFAPRVKLRVTDAPVRHPDRVLGEGTWEQIEGDLATVLALGAEAVVLDPDVPDVRDGTDPWPRLVRALHLLR